VGTEQERAQQLHLRHVTGNNVHSSGASVPQMLELLQEQSRVIIESDDGRHCKLTVWQGRPADDVRHCLPWMT
jgi:hypothetical protein